MVTGVWLVFAMAVGATASGSGKIAVLPTRFDQSAKSVPDIFDEYVLSETQKRSGMSVVGQDDINALLGFEQQKDLFGCDSASCIAEIGGALGVDRLVALKVARIGEQWAVTGKLIDIRAATVVSRASEFVTGETSALLQAIGPIIGHLFGGKEPIIVAAQPQAAEPVPQRLGAQATGYSSDNELFRSCKSENALACYQLQQRGQLERVGRYHRGFGWISLILGLGSLAGGAVWYGTEPSTTTVWGSSRDNETAIGIMALGGVVTVVGGLALIVGKVKLSNRRALVSEYLRGQPTSAAIPELELRPLSGGMTLGLTWRWGHWDQPQGT